MKSYIRKILQNFIHFQYSDNLTKQIHRWLISAEKSEEKEQALKEIWADTNAKLIIIQKCLLIMFWNA